MFGTKIVMKTELTYLRNMVIKFCVCADVLKSDSLEMHIHRN